MLRVSILSRLRFTPPPVTVAAASLAILALKCCIAPLGEHDFTDESEHLVNDACRWSAACPLLCLCLCPPPHSLCPHRHVGIHLQYHIGHYDNGCHSLPPGAPQPSHCPPGGRPANCAAPLPSAKGNCLNFMNGFKNKTDNKQNE